MNADTRNSWIAALIAIACVAVIAFAVRHNGPFAWDRQILLALRQPGDVAAPIGSAHFTGMVRDMTALGSVTALTSFVVIAIVCLALAKDIRAAGAVLFLIGGGQIISTLVKNIVERPRPDIVAPLALETSWSFPSGHAMMSMIAYLTFAAVLARSFKRPAPRLFLLGAALLLSLMIGASRLYIGVHWPSDVLAGWLLGLAWFLLWRPATRRLLGNSPA